MCFTRKSSASVTTIVIGTSSTDAYAAITIPPKANLGKSQTLEYKRNIPLLMGPAPVGSSINWDIDTEKPFHSLGREHSEHISQHVCFTDIAKFERTVKN